MSEHNISIGDGSVPDRWKDGIKALSAIHLSEQGERLIKHYESCRLLAYEDAKGIATIGWGSTRYADGRRVNMGDKITQRQADELFNLIVPKFEITVKSMVKRNLLQHEFDALVSFCYNAGTSYKAGNVWKDYQIWSNVNKGMTGEEMIKYWEKLAITSGGKVLNGLIKRRISEAHLYVFGVLILE